MEQDQEPRNKPIKDQLDIGIKNTHSEKDSLFNKC